MKNREFCLKNPILNPAISADRLAAFTTDHLGRLALYKQQSLRHPARVPRRRSNPV